jgi:RNA polymerase sigma factor (sigma-70 family)
LLGEGSKLAAPAADFYALVFTPARRGCPNDLRKVDCPEEESDELFMDTILVVMTKVDPIARDFDPPQMVNLLKVSCRRRLLDTRRHQSVIREVRLDRAVELADPAAASPEESAEARHAIAVGREALLSLAPRERRVCFLRRQMDLSPAEIREIVPGLSPRTYRRLIERSGARMQTAVERIRSGERCREVESLLGRLDPGRGGDEDRRLAAHLDHCYRCRQAAVRSRRDRRTGRR